jgi:hypothetical protein
VGVLAWRSSTPNVSPEYRKQESARVLDIAKKSELAAHGKPPAATATKTPVPARPR